VIDPRRKVLNTVGAMDPSHKSLCLIEDVPGDADDENPKLSTNGEWRDAMRMERKARGWSQTDLAIACGFPEAQDAISRVETGDVRRSHLVMPICRALEIEPPDFYTDEKMRRFYRDMEFVEQHLPAMAKNIQDHIDAARSAAEKIAEASRPAEQPPKKTGK
jgi:transcriptional regulator with XRE-family HTH domain